MRLRSSRVVSDLLSYRIILKFNILRCNRAAALSNLFSDQFPPGHAPRFFQFGKILRTSPDEFRGRMLESKHENISPTIFVATTTVLFSIAIVGIRPVHAENTIPVIGTNDSGPVACAGRLRTHDTFPASEAREREFGNGLTSHHR